MKQHLVDEKSPKMKIRVGIIGAGNWANYGHIPSMILLPDYEVVAIQSRKYEASHTAASKFGIKTVAESVEELVNNPEVDMVAVLTTAPQHEEGVRAAIAAGKLRNKSLRWTAPPNDFSHTIAIYGGHFLDALFQTVGHPVSLSSTLVNQFTGDEGDLKITNVSAFFTTPSPKT